MPDRDWDADRAYLRLLARCLWRPGLPYRIELSDVVHETIARALEHEGEFRGTSAAAWHGWLRKTLLNELRRRIRDDPSAERLFDLSSRCLEGALAADQTSPSQPAIRHEDLERLARALARLTEDQRTAIELKHLHDCSQKFIAEQMGLSEEAVEGLLKRGRKELRAILEGQQ